MRQYITVRGFVASVLGITVLLLLFYTYLSWNAVKDLDRAVTEYVISIKDVEKRSILEITLWKTLKEKVALCNGLVSSGKATVVQCNDAINSLILSFSSANGLYTCPEPVVYIPPRIRFVCPVEGYVGRAEFLIPVGAEVEP